MKITYINENLQAVQMKMIFLQYRRKLQVISIFKQKLQDLKEFAVYYGMRKYYVSHTMIYSFYPLLTGDQKMKFI